jgi:hypothetical protein
MSALIVVAALAAQASAPQTSPPPTSAPPAAALSDEPVTRGTLTYVDLEAGAGYSTNPNLSTIESDGAAFGRLSLNAVHTRLSERTTTVLSGFAQSVFYSNHLSSQQSLSLGASHDARVSEKLRVFGDLGLGYDEGGQLDTRVIGIPDVPLPPGTFQPPSLIGSGADFLSASARSYRATAHVGAQLALGARDYATATSGVEHYVTKNGSFDTRYTTVPVSIGYERQISARTTVGGRLAAAYTQYNGPANVRVITPQVTIQTVLSERLTLNGAAGISFARTDDGIDTRSSIGPSANMGLCYRGDLDNLCARAAIDEQNATSAGPARNVSIGVDYSRQLDANQTIGLSLAASRYSNPTPIVSGFAFSRATYVRAAGDYSRRIGNRLFAGASVSGRKIGRDGPDPKADVSGSLFLRYRLGDAR